MSMVDMHTNTNINHAQTISWNPTTNAVQRMVLSFFHSFQQDSIPINDQRLKSMAYKLDKEMDVYILNHALSNQCNMNDSSDYDDDETIQPSEEETNIQKDFSITIRHILLVTLNSAARLYISQLKNPLQPPESSLFFQSPSVKILKLLSVYFFTRTSKFYDCTDIILELCKMLSSKKALEEDFRAILCWWFGTCITQALTQVVATENRRQTMIIGSILQSTTEYNNNCCISNCLTLVNHLVLNDKSQKVRYAAILASCSILNHILNHRAHHADAKSLDTQQVLNCLLYAMADDSSCQNRSAVVAHIPLYEDTISSIIKRIRDENAKVRIDALHTLETKVDFLHLSTQQRIDILQFGLTQRCHKTFEAAVILLCCSWLKNMKFDTIAFVRLLDPVQNEQLCETVIQVILAVAYDTSFISSAASHNNLQDSFVYIQRNIYDSLSEHEIDFWKNQISHITVNLSSSRRTIDQEGEINTFDCPSSLYLKCHIQWVLATKVFPENHLSKILPDVPSLCQVLLNLIKNIQDLLEENNPEDSFTLDAEKDLLFTCKQVFLLFPFIDWNEEGSRRYFIEIASDILSSLDTHIDVIKSCLKALKLLYKVDGDFLSTVASILSNTNEKYSEADVQEIKDIHCLDILSASLNQCFQMTIRSNVMESFSQIIQNTIISEAPDIREAAVECLGRFALLLDEGQVLEKYKPLLIDISNNVNENDEVRGQAIMALCDLSTLYPSVLSPIVIEESRTMSYLQCLETLLKTLKSSLLTNVAAECVMKLHFADRIHNSNLLAYLVVLYFGYEPTNKNNSQENLIVGSSIRLHQLLTLFFPAYSMKSAIGNNTLLHTCTDVRRFVQEQNQQMNASSSRGRGRKSSVWPLDKMLDFLEHCVEQYIKDSEDPIEDAQTENSM